MQPALKRRSSLNKSVSYETLHSGAIVSIRLPKGLSPIKTIDGKDDSVIKFQQYSICLPGGVVNVQVHTDKSQVPGRLIQARVEIILKTTEYGRKFILINLHPVAAAEIVTNRLVVLDNQHEQGEGWEIFPTPNLDGFVALMEPEGKVLPRQIRSAAPVVLKPVRRTTPVKRVPAVHKTSGPPQDSPFAVLAGLIT